MAGDRVAFQFARDCMNMQTHRCCSREKFESPKGPHSSFIMFCQRSFPSKLLLPSAPLDETS
jgi:hypothetical protein